MTTRRTVKRREQRKRAKARAAAPSPGRVFVTPAIVMVAAMDNLTEQLRFANVLVTRRYDR